MSKKYSDEGIITFREGDWYFAELNGLGCAGETRAQAVSNLRKWLKERRNGED